MSRKRTIQPTNEKHSRPQHKASRNRALHIPLDFEKAVEGLLNTKPKKKHPKK